MRTKALRTTTLRTTPLETTALRTTVFRPPTLRTVEAAVTDFGYLCIGLAYKADEIAYNAGEIAHTIIETAPVIWKKTKPIREEALFLAENLVGWGMVGALILANGVRALWKSMEAIVPLVSHLGKSARTVFTSMKESAIAAWNFREELIAEWA